MSNCGVTNGTSDNAKAMCVSQHSYYPPYLARFHKSCLAASAVRVANSTQEDCTYITLSRYFLDAPTAARPTCAYRKFTLPIFGLPTTSDSVEDWTTKRSAILLI